METPVELKTLLDGLQPESSRLRLKGNQNFVINALYRYSMGGKWDYGIMGTALPWWRPALSSYFSSTVVSVSVMDLSAAGGFPARNKNIFLKIIISLTFRGNPLAYFLDSMSHTHMREAEAETLLKLPWLERQQNSHSDTLCKSPLSDILSRSSRIFSPSPPSFLLCVIFAGVIWSAARRALLM